MAQPTIDTEKPVEKRTRVELTLSRVLGSWMREPKGERFRRSFNDWLRSLRSSGTLRVYASSVCELFEWFERERGRVPLPTDIRRSDAIEYARWLRTRKIGLDEHRLEKDPERRIDTVIYDAVEANPGGRIDDVRRFMMSHPQLVTTVNVDGVPTRMLAMEVDNPEALAKRLACLVERKTLLREPSVEDIRTGRVDVGLEDPRQAGILYQIPPEVFRYWIRVDDRLPDAARSSTNATRLAALSSLWNFWIDSGENNDDERDKLLRFNIWTDQLKDAQQKAPARRALSRAQKTPDLEIAIQLLTQTFRKAYGERARDAAIRFFSGDEMPGAPSTRSSFRDVRDRAMLLVLSQLGLRASELASLRRSSLSTGDPPILSLVGKGDKPRQLPVPPAAQRALAQLDEKLEELAGKQRSAGRTRAEDLLEPDAPLVPAVAYWGRNGGRADVGMTRQGIAMALRRLAVRAGIDPSSDDFKRVHIHGFRHLFAHIAEQSGTRLPVIQKMLGHSSLGTTGVYVEEHRPEKLIAEAFKKTQPVPSWGESTAPAGQEQLQQVQPPEQPQATTPVEKAPTEAITGLVAVGAVPGKPKPPPATSAAETEEENLLLRLIDIYETNWGEKGSRYKLGGAVRSEAAREREKRALVQQALGLGAALEAGSDKLPQMYAGTRSGLVWWAGYAGDLSPELPVLSPDQAAQCAPGVTTTICSGLSELWLKWMNDDDKDRGPTAARALTLWLAEALDAASQAERYASLNQVSWVHSIAPWSDTDNQRTSFREHVPLEVVRWFEERAWQYATSSGGLASGKRSRRTPRARGALLELPSYYGVSDPISALPLDERQEMLDWLAAVTGQATADDRKLYGGASRKDIAEFVGLLCEYDSAVDQKHEAEGDSARAAAQALVDDVAGRLSAAAMRLTGKPFDVTSATRERKRALQASRTGKPLARESRQKRYLSFVQQLFGQAAARDAVIEFVARCGKPPLAEYVGLFRVDRSANTITHVPVFAKGFATEYGMHSECVARRIARDLWELRRRWASGEPIRAIERADAMVDLVTDLTGARVPCPRALELELRGRLGYPTEPIPVYETWKASRRQVPTSHVSEAEEAFSEMQEPLLAAQEFARELFAPNPAGIVLPNPVALLLAARL